MSKNRFAENRKQARRNFKNHAIDRLRDRYDLALDDAGWIDFKNHLYKSVLIYRETMARAVRRVNYAGKDILYIWDAHHGEVVTVLPKEDPRFNLPSVS